VAPDASKGGSLMFRPQFAYPTPLGYEDKDFINYFDYTNTNLLNNAALVSGALVQNIPLVGLQDAPFAWRATEIQGLRGADPVVAVLFKDCYGNPQSDDFVPIDLYRKPSGIAIVGTLPVAMEPDGFMPAGSVVWLSIKNQTASTQDLTKVRISMYGVKRLIAKVGKCA
jgi:hypothetical protein